MEANENFYPLNIFMATVWIWAYSYVIAVQALHVDATIKLLQD